MRRGSLEHHDELHGASEVRHLNRDVKGPGTGGIRHHLEGLNGLDAVTQLQKEIRSIERGTIVRIDETSLEAPLRAAAREVPIGRGDGEGRRMKDIERSIDGTSAVEPLCGNTNRQDVRAIGQGLRNQPIELIPSLDSRDEDRTSNPSTSMTSS